MKKPRLRFNPPYGFLFDAAVFFFYLALLLVAVCTALGLAWLARWIIWQIGAIG